MKSTADLSQWRDRTEEPVIIWAPVSDYTAEPVAVDDSHEADVYDEYARAWYAARTYQTREELDNDASWYDLTPDQIEELYQRGDGSAERAGLPSEYYAEGVNEDGSDALIYVDEATVYNTHRETLEEATPYLDPESVAEIYRAILAARKEYDY